MSSNAAPHAFLGSRSRILARRSSSPRRATKDPKNAQVAAFRALVWRYWKKHGRHELAWRKTKDPYRIMVSEVMLQQTQVPRVIEKYKEFLKVFPNVRALGRAPLADVLRVWSGLGYNRRGKYLHDAAKSIVKNYGGRVPKDSAALRALQGIGEYTASAIRVFAFNEPDVLIETNVRAAFIHHFFADTFKISDSLILTYADRAAGGQDPRKWQWALMDYGSHIKKLCNNPARKSAHYAKQSKFEGSLRQVRGAILRTLTEGGKTGKSIYILIRANKHIDGSKIKGALASLVRDGLIDKRKGKWTIV